MDFTNRWSLIAGVLGTFALSAPPTPPAALPNPCSLLTLAQLSSVMGSSFDAGSPISATGCAWHSKPNVTVTLVVQDASLWDRATAPLAGVQRIPVSGIGDAGMYTVLGELASLGVKKGAVTVIIRMYGVHPLDKQKTLEKSLASDAISTL